MLLHLTKGKYLPTVEQLNLALKNLLFERTLFTFASKQAISTVRSSVSVKKNCTLREVYEEVPTMIYPSDNLTNTSEHSRINPKL